MPGKLALGYFLHSIRSDWNNGNAHFQRGLLRALAEQGHEVTCFEQEHAWSIDNLRMEPLGEPSLCQFAGAYQGAYPGLSMQFYQQERESLRAALRDLDVVIVHEWNPPELVEIVLGLRDEIGFRALFHDTHHRASSSPEQMAALEIASFDGVLAFGESLRQIYLRRFGISQVWTLHEAADTALFHPREGTRTMDTVWIGNWGDDERSREIEEYLVSPAAELPQYRFAVYGVRYPEHGLSALSRAGIEFRGYLPNLSAPDVYAAAALTVHIPRQQYREAMVGIPTIRVFEALASGIPLISAPWNDVERLFCPGDFLIAEDGKRMRDTMRRLLENPAEAREMASRGLETIRSRHTCAHRAEQLAGICEEVLAV